MKSFPHYPRIDPKKVYEDFLSDLHKSSKGEQTSIRWIINTLPPKQEIKEDEIIQVLVVGGTICKSALVKVTRTKITILSEKDIPKPPFPTEESFLTFISNNIESSIDTVVMNAADTIQPVISNGVLDGIFLVSTKENKMEGLVGKKLGEEISKYYFTNSGRKIKIHIANDTVCLLLSGLSEFHWGEIAGGILGTGSNIALFLDGRTVINLEAGGYTNIAQSEPGKEIDAASSEIGEYLIEKETAGGYLFKHFNYWVKKENIDVPQITKSSELSEVIKNNDTVSAYLAQEILEYSATLFACQIAATLKFLNRDTTFIMQGSMFWKGYGYKVTVEEAVKELVPNLHARFVQVENADILGAARVVV